LRMSADAKRAEDDAIAAIARAIFFITVPRNHG
jgi:hypothetical protein